MDGTGFQINVGVSAGDVPAAATSVDTLASALATAGKASQAAGDAVKAASASYTAAETTANKAAQALEKAGLAIDEQRSKVAKAMALGDTKGVDAANAKLGQLVARQTEAAIAAAKANQNLAAQAASLDQLKTAAEKAAEAETKMGKELEAAKLAEGTGKASDAASAFAQLPGPLGAAAQKGFMLKASWEKLSSSLGSSAGLAVAAVGLAAVAAVLFVVIAGAAAGALSLARFAVSAADAARTSSLLSAGIAQSVAGGKQLDATIAGLATKVPQTAEELQAMAADLAKTGLKGDALSKALEAAAVKAAQVKFGPDFAKQMLSVDNQSKRLKANVTGLFAGIGIEGLLTGMSKVVALFDANTASGKAIKVVFESIFQPIIDGAAAMLPKVVSAFIQFEIWALRALIAIKPYGSKIEAVGQAFVEMAAVAAVPLGLVAAAVGVAALQVGMLVVAAGWLLTKFYDARDAAIGFASSLAGQAGGAFDALREKAMAVVSWLAGVSLSDIGAAMVQGLASGIFGAGPAVLASITGVVGDAVKGAKAFLGIASPSKLLADEVGGPMVEGVQGPLEDGAAEVQGSLERMVKPPQMQSGGGSPENSSGSSLNLAGATFTFQGVQGMEDAEARFGGMLTRIVEGDVSMLGGSAVPA